MNPLNSINISALANQSLKAHSLDNAQKTAVTMDIKPSANNVASVSTQVVSSASVAENAKNDQELAGQSTQPSEEKVEKAVSSINDFLQTVQRNLQFVLDEDSGAVVVQVKNETGSVIKQIPAKEALELARRLDELRGLLFEDKV